MTASTFRALHQDRAAGDPLVLPGPWDAASARVLADAGYPRARHPERRGRRLARLDGRLDPARRDVRRGGEDRPGRLRARIR